MCFTCFPIKGVNIYEMRFILVSAEDSSVKRAIEIPKEIVVNQKNIQSEVIKPVEQPAKSQKTQQPAEAQKSKRKKSPQTSKSIIHG